MKKFLKFTFVIYCLSTSMEASSTSVIDMTERYCSKHDISCDEESLASYLIDNPKAGTCLLLDKNMHETNRKSNGDWWLILPIDVSKKSYDLSIELSEKYVKGKIFLAEQEDLDKAQAKYCSYVWPNIKALPIGILVTASKERS